MSCTALLLLGLLLLQTTVALKNGCGGHRDGYVLFSANSGEGLQLYSMKNSNLTSIPRTTSWGSEYKVTYDWANRKLYWHIPLDREKGIMRANFNGTGIEKVARVPGYSTALAYDWIGNNIYVLDNGFCSICTDNGKTCVQFQLKDRGHSAGLALDPLRGKMYWSDRKWGIVNKANMDLTDAKAIVTDIAEAGEVVVDFQASRLYWVDYGRGESLVETSELDGKGRHYIWVTPGFPIGLGILGNYLYWQDRDAYRVLRRRKDVLETTETKLVFQTKNSTSQFVGGFTVMHSTNQPLSPFNPCAGKGCTHICVLRSNGSRCMCPDRLKLGADSATCGK